jgi:patatin-like phospholipase/acyl hydrolase
VLVDGGIIANEPALYSYLHAVYSLKKPDNIRMVSIGTGQTVPGKLDNTTNQLTWYTQLAESLITAVE